jgi:hypothetical protein
MQLVSVEWINKHKAQLLAPELCSSTNTGDYMHRYQLSPYKEASTDGIETPFICRFQTNYFKTGQPFDFLGNIGHDIAIDGFFEMVMMIREKRAVLSEKE